MPELPEVETVRQGLELAMTGHVIDSIRLMRDDLRQPFPDRMIERMEGVRVERIQRRAKYLLIELSTDDTLLVHLGMSGSFVIGSGSLERHDHVEFCLRDGRKITYRDPRRFGLMDLVESCHINAHPLLARLGPEPLSNEFNGNCLIQALAGRSSSIKTALLNQSVVAGLGNIYACEALWRCGISPRRRADRISPQRIQALAEAVVAVLREAVAVGGASLRDHRRVDGNLGCFQHAFNVYGRQGAPCPRIDCSGSIRRVIQAGRSTHYCPGCQR